MNRTTTIFLVQGNTLKLAIPLKLRTISFSDGNAVCEDDDFIPSSDSPVTVELTDQSKKLAFEASMEGNVAVIEDRGNIPTGFYAVSVLCKDNEGNPYRFKQKAALRVVDTTEEAGITPPIEYEVKTRYLNAAIFLALKGEGGGGTVTAVKMNNDEPISPDGDGVVSLGTVLTRHQDISGKVDKVTGKGLSTEDYTSAEKAKLAGQPMWLDAATRQQLRISIDAYQATGATEVTKWFGGQQFTFPTTAWLQMLNALEVYAAEALNVTESHVAAVSALESVEAVEAYDYTAGYPTKLNLTPQWLQQHT